MTFAIRFKDIESAHSRLQGVAHVTPALTSSTLNEKVGAQVFLKAENFQRMGAFKFRGAYNALSQFTSAQRQKGVVAFSSGNHAQAIALSARLLGMRAVIVMPKDAPSVKLAATKEYGAEVVTYDRYTEDREAIGLAFSEREGLTLIPPYDHPHVMAGQGTAAKELFEQVGKLDILMTPVGGGGLISGCAVAAKTLNPACKVIGVEPEAGNDAQQSLQAGKIVHIPTPQTLADGAQTQHIGQLTFPVMQSYVDEIVTVSDAALVRAMGFLAGRLKVVVEPTGCLGVAALLEQVVDCAGLRVGVVLSGGNIDVNRFGELLHEYSAK